MIKNIFEFIMVVIWIISICIYLKYMWEIMKEVLPLGRFHKSLKSDHQKFKEASYIYNLYKDIAFDFFLKDNQNVTRYGKEFDAFTIALLYSDGKGNNFTQRWTDEYEVKTEKIYEIFKEIIPDFIEMEKDKRSIQREKKINNVLK